MLQGDWCDIPPAANKKIREAYMAGETKIDYKMKLDDRICDYTYDFTKNLQLATYSGKSRQARAPWDLLEEVKLAAAAEADRQALLAGGDVGGQKYTGKGNEKIAKARAALLRQMEKTNLLKLKGNTDIEFLAALRAETKKVLTMCVEAPLSEEECRPLRDRLRKVHNFVQDAKGAIRVYVRTRPFNQREVDMGSKKCLYFQDDQMGLELKNLDGDSMKFMFDTTFNPGTQEEVYEELSDLIQSAYDGYNIVVFAYGQTGSGKTHTMYGPKNNPGVVTRAIKDVFKEKDKLGTRCSVTVTVSMVELYNAVFSDLLANDIMKQPQLTIRKDDQGNTYMENCQIKQCKTPENFWDLVQKGFDNRKTAATAMNSESSRSHLILTVKIDIQNKETKQKLVGKLTMVDLAGSERVKDSMVEGQQLKEAIEINKALTTLGDVMEGLTTGQKRIGYRNHPLTQILADSLGGTSKTLMFANISPSVVNFNETIQTCKWATRAKKVTNDGGKAKAASAKAKSKASPKAVGARTPQGAKAPAGAKSPTAKKPAAASPTKKPSSPALKKK